MLETGSRGPDPQCSILSTHRHASQMVKFFIALSFHSPVIKSKVMRKDSSRQKPCILDPSLKFPSSENLLLHNCVFGVTPFKAFSALLYKIPSCLPDEGSWESSSPCSLFLHFIWLILWLLHY